ncbi:helix-turn-helix domain-containing protein [Streptomyces sp. TRM49041]|uniref:helix-turn-helix domain-containing protein n=1 Tax=Streptomyces sp. TRM49041 TaxID=2603216 RepID=UPI0021CC853E|nr:helix-turn-helix domain-containing protein [Streptomyces sp. TRM49041]
MTHIRHRHREKFTVVGNHLAQHQGLSACAVGIGVYIQSLPDGAPVTIKVLAAHFREGERRIAQALNELQEAGYLERERRRVDGARIVTFTRWYEHPHQRRAAAVPEVKSRVATPPTPTPTPAPRPAVPHRPPAPLPDALRPAARLLAGLRQREPRLPLCEQDVHRLAPLLQEWLARGFSDSAVFRTLTGDLPSGTIRWPARLIEYRLREWVPPHVPDDGPDPGGRPLPLQNCDRCDHAFRAAEPGVCPGCAAAAG